MFSTREQSGALEISRERLERFPVHVHDVKPTGATGRYTPKHGNGCANFFCPLCAKMGRFNAVGSGRYRNRRRRDISHNVHVYSIALIFRVL